MRYYEQLHSTHFNSFEILKTDTRCEDLHKVTVDEKSQAIFWQESSTNICLSDKMK